MSSTERNENNKNVQFYLKITSTPTNVKSNEPTISLNQVELGVLETNDAPVGEVALTASVVTPQEPPVETAPVTDGEVALTASVVTPQEPPVETAPVTDGKVDLIANVETIEKPPVETIEPVTDGEVDLTATVEPAQESPVETAPVSVGEVALTATVDPAQEPPVETAPVSVGEVALTATVDPAQEPPVETAPVSVGEVALTASVETAPVTDGKVKLIASVETPQQSQAVIENVGPEELPKKNLSSNNNAVVPQFARPSTKSDNAYPSIRHIGLQGTIYFYVNQETDAPLLMSGYINHNFDVTDTINNCKTNLPIQLTHNINQNTITSTTPPFNATVDIKGDLCIGGIVYTITDTDRTINVRNISHISPITYDGKPSPGIPQTPTRLRRSGVLTLPDSPSTIGKPDKTFVHKYFEYSGKIYVDDWVSPIHWRTFYNPDNYKVTQDLPTHQNTKPGEDLSAKDNGNWALYQRKIHMYIGEVKVMGNLPISPPPFDINMQKTSVSSGGRKESPTPGKKGELRRPSVTSTSTSTPQTTLAKLTEKYRTVLDEFIREINNIDDSNLRENIKKKLLAILDDPHTQGEVNKISKIIEFLKEKERTSTVAKSTQTKSSIISKLVEHVKSLMSSKTNQNPKGFSLMLNQLKSYLNTRIEKTLKRRNPEELHKVNAKSTHVSIALENTITIQISGKLTYDGSEYAIHHRFTLEKDENLKEDEPDTIYNVTQIKTDTEKHTQGPNANYDYFYLQGNIVLTPFFDHAFSVHFNELSNKIELLQTGTTSKSKKPTLHIERIHIYNGEHTATHENLIGMGKIAEFTLYNDESKPPNDNVVCDFSSNIKVTDTTGKSRTQFMFEGKVVDKHLTAHAVKSRPSSATKNVGKKGGRRTRRFRRK